MEVARPGAGIEGLQRRIGGEGARGRGELAVCVHGSVEDGLVVVDGLPQCYEPVDVAVMQSAGGGYGPFC